MDGYPRSGNTYSLHLIKTLYPDLGLVHHFHAIAPIKIALKKKIPVFILVRDPMNAITSWYLKELSFKGQGFDNTKIDIALLGDLAQYYYIYYQWVVIHKIRLQLIPFKELIDNPISIMKRVNFSLPEDIRLTESYIFAGVEAASKTGFGAKDKLGASLPTKEKEEAKSFLKEKLASTSVYQDCLKVFNELQT